MVVVGAVVGSGSVLVFFGVPNAADELVHIHGTEVFGAFAESVLEFIEGK